MVEEVAAYTYTATTGIAWSQIDPHCVTAVSARSFAYQTLKAIKPMIGKLIGDAQASEWEVGYRAGYQKARADLEARRLML